MEMKYEDEKYLKNKTNKLSSIYTKVLDPNYATSLSKSNVSKVSVNNLQSISRRPPPIVDDEKYL